MPACGTIVGQALEFGITDDEASLTTQSVSMTNKMDKKEARDSCGVIVSVAYYNPTSEISIEGLGTVSATVGTTLSLSGTYLTPGGGSTARPIYVDEVTVEKENEEFVKSSIRATSYDGIASS